MERKKKATGVKPWPILRRRGKGLADYLFRRRAENWGAVSMELILSDACGVGQDEKEEGLIRCEM